MAAALKRNDSIFKVDISDSCYHLRLRLCDQQRLAFKDQHRVYVPSFLNRGLPFTPWSFTKAIKPVVTILGKRGHRVFVYLDEFYGAARSSTLCSEMRLVGRDRDPLVQNNLNKETRDGVALQSVRVPFSSNGFAACIGSDPKMSGDQGKGSTRDQCGKVL